MNILIPHSWLLEHLETEAKPEKIQSELSLAGPSVERIFQDPKTKEAIYDIEITTNRVDAMSVRGVAREAAVILSQVGIPAKLKKFSYLTAEEIKPDKSILLALPKIKNDPKLSRRLMCVVLDKVTQADTPDWMTKRLSQIEMNVHNAAIDITNYVTHELGHPCHAFDYDKIMETGGEIIVSTAKPGKTFTTLDGESYQTLGGEVVFTNSKGEIIDLPSIKGTQNTSVDESTTRILLLMESIAPDKVRFASMSHAIRTVAAQLLEKGVDPNLQDFVMGMAVKLYQDLCGAKIASEVFDTFPGKSEPKTIVTSKQLIDQYLGIELPIKTISEILNKLECQVEWDAKQINIKVKPPTFRPDLNIPADLVEEIARTYGFHNLPSVLMETAIPTKYPDHTDFNLEYQVKALLANLGWQEIYSYSLVSDALAMESGTKLANHLHLANPLTSDREYLRVSHLPSLKEVMTDNPQIRPLSLFELANVYPPQENQLPKEQMLLSLLSTLSYREVRGAVETIFDRLFITNYEFKTTGKANKANIYLGKDRAELISAGQIEVLSGGLIAVELDWQTLLKASSKHPHYQPLPDAPPVIEDLTFTLTEDEKIGKVIQTIQKSSKIIKQVDYKDSYRLNHTFTIYYQAKKSLSVDDVQPIRKKIVENVISAHQAKLVGEI